MDIGGPPLQDSGFPSLLGPLAISSEALTQARERRREPSGGHPPGELGFRVLYDGERGPRDVRASEDRGSGRAPRSSRAWRRGLLGGAMDVLDGAVAYSGKRGRVADRYVLSACATHCDVYCVLVRYRV